MKKTFADRTLNSRLLPSETVLRGDLGEARVERPPRQQHLRRMLAADRTRQRDHRGRAEEPDAYAGRGEARALARDDQIAGRGKLASGRGSDCMHSRDHRLRDRLNRMHKLRAQIEFIAVELEIAP